MKTAVQRFSYALEIIAITLFSHVMSRSLRKARDPFNY
jgi:hypothetical protein